MCRPCFGWFLWTGVVFWGVFRGGAILRIGVFVYIGDCLYICMIYILSVVCPVGEGIF